VSSTSTVEKSREGRGRCSWNSRGGIELGGNYRNFGT
jgi:hypothetical protein